MVSLSLVFLLINILLIVAIVFLNVSKARLVATSFIILDIILVFLKLFDAFINNNAIEDFFINAIASLNLTINTSRYITFMAGLLVLLQWLVIWITIYALLRKFITYKPRILLTKREERIMTNESFFWKFLLLLSSNVVLIYALTIVNYATNLDLGFLEILFSIGFGVR